MKCNPTYHFLLFLCVLFYQNPMHSQWTAQTSPTNLPLEAVHFFDSNIGLVAGSHTLLYKTPDGGISWTSMGNYPAHDLSFADATTGYAVSMIGESIKKTTNGGTNWSAITPPTSSSYLGVFAASATLAFFINTEDKVLRTDNSGNTFLPRTIPLASSGTQNLTDVFFTDDYTGYITAQGFKNIYKTVNSGGTWNLLNSGITTSLNSIYFVDSLLGYAAGESGIVLKTTDAGITWTPKSTGSDSFLNQIKFFNANNGIVVGNAGKIYLTNDGGDSWTSEDSGTTSDLNNLFYLSGTSAIIVGNEGIILKNTNLPLSSNNFTIDDTFQLFPNPTSDHSVLTIKNINSFSNLELEIYNTSGQLLKKEMITSNQHLINKDNYNIGVYLIKINEGSKLLKTLKLIVR
jgi:photosystem II stability/assembly factor-like uncharacterized protein